MSDFFHLLKGEINALNIVLFIMLMAFVLKKLKRDRFSRAMTVFAVILFVLFSTPFFPKYFVGKIESTYPPLDPSTLAPNQFYHIFVLGGGYINDERVPPLGQLTLITQGRLNEGIRLYHQLDSSMIIVSGFRANGIRTAGEVTWLAANSLGVAPERLDSLNSPRTTAQEAEAFKLRFGQEANLILVSDAMHLPRAMKIFQDAGFKPLAAPTNFLVREASEGGLPDFLPSTDNLVMSNRIIWEFFATLKAKWF